jgi:hypothetical protein
MLKRMLRSNNGRARWLVGLMLIGLFLVHGTHSRIDPVGPSIATAVDISDGGLAQTARRARLEDLARTDHAALLRLCLQTYENTVRDYTCTLTKQERIDGRLREAQTIAVKFLDEPFSVGMVWQKNAPRGDRVLYVEGRWGGNMLVRPSSAFARAIVPTAQRRPDGPDAMKSTLRPVSSFGFRRSLESLLEVYVHAAEQGELVQEFGGYAKVGDRTALILIRRVPDTDYYRSVAAPLTRTYIDVESLVPLMVEGLEADGEQRICLYCFRDVKFNVGLSSDDFQPEDFDLVRPN